MTAALMAQPELTIVPLTIPVAAEAETARLERMLAAARFRPEHGENEYRL